MTVYSIKSGLLGENTYLVLKEGKALVIDPGVSAEIILSECRKLSVDPIAVLLTHGHVDHIFGAPGLQKAGIKVYAHSREIEVVQGRANLALALGISLSPFTPDVAIEEGALALSPFSVEVIFTPGHTQGGVCYLIDGALFSGDTLFAGSYGRTDFPTGDEQDLLCSIANELFSLPLDTPVYAGHSAGEPTVFERAELAFPDTKVANEYSTNPILNLL